MYRNMIANKLIVLYEILITFADCTEEEAYVLLKKCVREIQKRLIVNLPNFKIQKISKDGIKDMQPITAENLAVESVAKA